MDEEDFHATMGLVLNSARMLRILDLEGFVSACNRADSVGPIVDPTLWMKGHGDLDRCRRIAAAAKNFVTVVEEAAAEEVAEKGRGR